MVIPSQHTRSSLLYADPSDTTVIVPVRGCTSHDHHCRYPPILSASSYHRNVQIESHRDSSSLYAHDCPAATIRRMCRCTPFVNDCHNMQMMPASRPWPHWAYQPPFSPSTQDADHVHVVAITTIRPSQSNDHHPYNVQIRSSCSGWPKCAHASNVTAMFSMCTSPYESQFVMIP